MSAFSFDCFSVVVKMHRYPFTQAASARPIPVFPLVPSMIVPPGFIFPSASATSSILSAIRSLMLLPGLKYSTLANTVHGRSFVILLILINGVFPRSEEHTSELQSRLHLVCRLLL